MLFLKHGVHVVEEDVTPPSVGAGTAEGRMSAIAVSKKAVGVPPSTPFDYLFDNIADDPEAHLPATDPKKIVDALLLLGAAMVDQAPPAQSNSIIPPIYTY